MKSFFKRSAIGLAVLGIAGSVSAMPAATGGMPSMHGYFVGVEALRLRPMNGDLDYYTVYKNNGGYDTRGISTDHDWAWRLFGGVKFGDNDDLTVSWTRLRSTSSDKVDFHDVSHYIRYDIYSSSDAARAKVTFDLDEVYAVMGHTINFNNPWSVRFAAGLAYARLDSDLSLATVYSSYDPYDSVVDKSTMKGWGPRAEFDATYHLGNNFALFANTNAELLVADRDVNNYYYDTSGDFDYDYHFAGRNVVIPKLGMRLGGSYTHMMGQAGAEGAGGSSITLTAGWQVESYIHAVERTDYWYGNIASTKVSNFGDHGLFLGVTYNSSWM